VRIAIVNDMAMAVEVLRRIVSSVPAYHVAWVARDGAEAVRKCAEDRPDLVLMDLIMPVMDGVEATRQIMAKAKCAILVVTANVTVNLNKVYEAMGFGALDAVNTPLMDKGLKSDAARVLLTKIDTIAQLVLTPVRTPTVFLKNPNRPVVTGFPPLIAIGASTGGPNAIASILAALPANLPASIVIIQHIDHVFADGLASWLGKQTALKVRIAVEDQRPQVGTVDIAATNDHLVLRDNSTFGYTRHPLDLPYRPSVDIFFQSIVSLVPGSVIGVLLTGIGADGAAGLLKLRERGHHTIAQNEATSVVFGMPKAGIELGAAAEVLAAEQIPYALINRLERDTTLEKRKPIDLSHFNRR
jgi:two-component system response regulator WspF